MKAILSILVAIQIATLCREVYVTTPWHAWIMALSTATGVAIGILATLAWIGNLNPEPLKGEP